MCENCVARYGFDSGYGCSANLVEAEERLREALKGAITFWDMAQVNGALIVYEEPAWVTEGRQLLSMPDKTGA